MNHPVRNLLLPFIIILSFFSCNKESFTTNSDAFIRTDTDTLHFDTVFTSTGSASQVFKIFNDNNKGLKIQSIQLAGGASSPFKMNVDGIAGAQTSNVEIAANDSAYVFITVTINPTASNLPFIIRDSIQINYNGNTKWVQLDAFGQNAHFLRNKNITANETWTNDLPYVIVEGLQVKPGVTLTINEGCKIYMHADAPFIVEGSLHVNGDKWDSTRVVFSGDRLDEPYRDFPASFPGIIFTETSQDNILHYAIIKNAYQGIVSIEKGSGTKLSLQETIIDNAYDAGILGVNTSIDARNVLISNCGKNLVLVKGGDYHFTHSTVVAYSNNFIQHKEPLVLVTNYLKDGNNVVANPLTASFTNCIFWAESGLVENEIVIAKDGNTDYSVSFNNVLWPLKTNPTNATVSDILNADPQFDMISISERQFNFRLKETSPAIDAGKATSVSVDLDGKNRPVNLPDLGAYEKD